MRDLPSDDFAFNALYLAFGVEPSLEDSRYCFDFPEGTYTFYQNSRDNWVVSFYNVAGEEVWSRCRITITAAIVDVKCMIRDENILKIYARR